MKTLSILTSVIAFGILSAHGQQAAEAARSTAQVTIRADAKTDKPEKEKKADNGNKDKNKAKQETVTKSLEVELSAAKTINGPLKMVTFWVARDLKSKDPVVAKKEESEVPLDASKTAKATVPSFAFTTTSASTQKDSKGKMERVDASGQAYAGWVIRVYEGAILVGEAASSPPMLKLHE
ncbi:MAG: hypothetical protein ABIT37_03335 [Luteolibacter sp.]